MKQRLSALAFHRMEPAGAERHRREARRVSLLAQTNQTPYNCPCLNRNLSSPLSWVANRTGKRCGTLWKRSMILVCRMKRVFYPPIAPRMRPQSLREKRRITDCELSSPAPAARRIWRESLLLTRGCPFSGFRFNRSSRDSTLCYPPRKCQAAFPSVHWRSAKRARKTLRFSPRRFSPRLMRRFARNLKHSAKTSPKPHWPRDCQNDDGDFNRPRCGG